MYKGKVSGHFLRFKYAVAKLFIEMNVLHALFTREKLKPLRGGEVLFQFTHKGCADALIVKNRVDHDLRDNARIALHMPPDRTGNYAVDHRF